MVGYIKIIAYFRHLNQRCLTLDGNHHASQFKKNTDSADVSALEGHAYSPVDTTYKEYLQRTGTSADEVR
jgi:hypothetical protein